MEGRRRLVQPRRRVDKGHRPEPGRHGRFAHRSGSKARRKLAYDLGIDPYTTFEPLNAELTRVASASAVGETGVNIGLAFVTGGAGIAISVGGRPARCTRCCATRPLRSSRCSAALGA